MKFIGIDLAWKSRNPTGVCSLEWVDHQVKLSDAPHRIVGHDAVLAWIASQVLPTHAAVVAVDAPLVIPNSAGFRQCESQVGSAYGKRHAGCHSMNLGNQCAAGLVDFSDRLAALDFIHGCDSHPQSMERQMIEVYPHPATIELFDLPKILRYKARPGRTQESRAEELTRLRDYLLSLRHAEPPLCIAVEDLPTALHGETLSVKKLKAAEDMLDALMCAYIAAHWWYWGAERNTVFGDAGGGYIIVPRGKAE